MGWEGRGGDPKGPSRARRLPTRPEERHGSGAPGVGMQRACRLQRSGGFAFGARVRGHAGSRAASVSFVAPWVMARRSGSGSSAKGLLVGREGNGWGGWGVGGCTLVHTLMRRLEEQRHLEALRNPSKAFEAFSSSSEEAAVASRPQGGGRGEGIPLLTAAPPSSLQQPSPPHCSSSRVVSSSSRIACTSHWRTSRSWRLAFSASRSSLFSSSISEGVMPSCRRGTAGRRCRLPPPS